MVELLAHTSLSDGQQSPAEALRSASMLSYRALVIADHCDASNLELNINAIKQLKESALHMRVDLVVGVELTHIPAALIGQYIDKARNLGAEFVAVHGERVNLNIKMSNSSNAAEFIERGTNLAAILGGADLLAHPGFIREEEVLLAKEHKVLIGLTAESKSSLTNGHIAKMASALGAQLVVCANPHKQVDFLNLEEMNFVAKGAGLDEAQARQAIANTSFILNKIYKR